MCAHWSVASAICICALTPGTASRSSGRYRTRSSTFCPPVHSSVRAWSVAHVGFVASCRLAQRAERGSSGRSSGCWGSVVEHGSSAPGTTSTVSRLAQSRSRSGSRSASGLCVLAAAALCRSPATAPRCVHSARGTELPASTALLMLRTAASCPSSPVSHSASRSCASEASAPTASPLSSAMCGAGASPARGSFSGAGAAGGPGNCIAVTSRSPSGVSTPNTPATTPVTHSCARRVPDRIASPTSRTRPLWSSMNSSPRSASA